MVDDIKKMMGINNNDFDSIITTYIKSAKIDLKEVGLKEDKVTETDALIYSAIVSYVLALLDVNYSEMYTNAYIMQKDTLRHLTTYIGG